MGQGRAVCLEMADDAALARRCIHKIILSSSRLLPNYLDTEYDRAKVPPYNGNDPRPPLVV